MRGNPRDRFILFTLLVIATAIFTTGITWGLPSRRVDPFLFGSRTPWTGEQIMALTQSADEHWEDPGRGADVASGMLAAQPALCDGGVIVNATDAQRAQIVRRYRLFTYQPDEMITLMSLAKMHPGNGDFDPRLYQYGGLWIYPVGALLKVASLFHLVQLRSGPVGLAFYLDHPEAFSRFYVVARLYSAAWGLAGVWAVFRIVRLLVGQTVPAALAALLFCLMPVVINMAHEAKPHLPGAVIGLLAILAAVRYVRLGRLRDGLLAGSACGAAFAMVLSTLPIFSILPLMTLFRPISWRERLKVTVVAVVAGVCIYAATNPYVAIHQFWHHEVFQSNVGNSTAMYHIGPPLAGMLNEARLVADGMSVPLALAGITGAMALGLRAMARRNDRSEPEGIRRATGLLLAAPALLIAGQFAMIGGGKPGEFGRFLLLPDIFLMIEAVVALATFLPERTEPSLFSARGLAWSHNLRGVIRTLAATILLASTGLGGFLYLNGFYADSQPQTSRIEAARQLQIGYEAGARRLVVAADPAPYCLPPVDLFQWTILKVREMPLTVATPGPAVDLLVRPVDCVPGRSPLMCTPISWAAKPLEIESRSNAGRKCGEKK